MGGGERGRGGGGLLVPAPLSLPTPPFLPSLLRQPPPPCRTLSCLPACSPARPPTCPACLPCPALPCLPACRYQPCATRTDRNTQIFRHLALTLGCPAVLACLVCRSQCTRWCRSRCGGARPPPSTWPVCPSLTPRWTPCCSEWRFITFQLFCSCSEWHRFLGVCGGDWVCGGLGQAGGWLPPLLLLRLLLLLPSCWGGGAAWLPPLPGAPDASAVDGWGVAAASPPHRQPPHQPDAAAPCRCHASPQSHQPAASPHPHCRTPTPPPHVPLPPPPKHHCPLHPLPPPRAGRRRRPGSACGTWAWSTARRARGLWSCGATPRTTPSPSSAAGGGVGGGSRA